MPTLTSQQLTRFYNEYSTVEVTFTKEVIRAILLYPKQVYLKCLGYQWPCIIFSSSMTTARIIVSMRANVKPVVEKANNHVQLRYSFLQRDKSTPLLFFVPAEVTSFQPYDEKHPELSYLDLSFTQRPPDDLIEAIGSLIDANAASSRRREERVVMIPDAMKRLGIPSRGTVVMVDNIPRKCILRDISFGGAKVIIMGLAKFLLNKRAIIRLTFEDPDEQMDIAGQLIRHEPVEGREDIAAFAMQFEESAIPISYKLRLNAYMQRIKVPKGAAQRPAAGEANG